MTPTHLSRSEAPGSFPGRVLSAVASGFTGLMRSSAPAAKRVGDQGEGRGAFDNTPVQLSASATPMMSGSEREGTPCAAGFLGASDVMKPRHPTRTAMVRARHSRNTPGTRRRGKSAGVKGFRSTALLQMSERSKLLLLRVIQHPGRSSAVMVQPRLLSRWAIVNH